MAKEEVNIINYTNWYCISFQDYLLFFCYQTLPIKLFFTSSVKFKFARPWGQRIYRGSSCRVLQRWVRVTKLCSSAPPYPWGNSSDHNRRGQPGTDHCGSSPTHSRKRWHFCVHNFSALPLYYPPGMHVVL